jgi:polar amino acid transport system substrate-binding protein
VGLLALDVEQGSLILTEAGSKRRASLHVVSGDRALAAHNPGGVEVLEIDLPTFQHVLQEENHTLKRALTDPHLFSGIGNAYSDEILHAVRLSPFKQTRSVSDEEVRQLYDATRVTLVHWIDRLRAETADGFPDKVTPFREGMAVHGRYGQACPDCGSPVQRIVYAANEANYCATCQTGGRLLADRSLSRLMHEDWPRTLEEWNASAVGRSILFRLLLRCVVIAVLFGAAAAAAQSPQELRWGGDAEGGAPFVEADPRDPSRLIGFDFEVAALLARELGRAPRFIQVSFTSLDASAARGDFDIGLSGIEDSPARRARLAVTIPYYEFREILTVRAADRDRFRTLADLRGRRVATLGATLAYDLLVRAEAEHGVVPVTYEDDVHPYTDLAVGRVDAVVLDYVLAERGVNRNAGLLNQDTDLGVGHYVGVLAPGQTALRDQINGILRDAMRDGRLEDTFRRWNMWNEDQPRLYARVLAGDGDDTLSPFSGSAAALGPWEATRRYFPSLLQAAVITLVLSCAAMALAVLLGAIIASGRVYGPRALQVALTTYVEVIRGTPLLLQLFVLYFGLASVVQLPAFVAALLGLAMNYAAYESEIYRGALEAVPIGQLDAARTLGFSEAQTLALVRAPQAFRFALAPMTNDFVALLKDSSLVSVITVVELTKQTSIFAANIGSWVIPGALCAGLYLMLSLPLARLARRLENRWRRR